jgi:hypothetical protein|tara:strand:+ start:2167 stop:3039 length:873 start_codon:yes stop_codon:yes gene_type:complete
MDYHKERFEDYSLMVYKNGKLLALLPANIKNNIIYSHQGLSYGGVVYIKDVKFKDSLAVFESILKYLKKSGHQKLYLNPIPKFYNSKLSEESSYFLFILEAKLRRRDTLSVIRYSDGLSLSKSRKEGISRAQKKGLEIKEVDEFDEFWNDILIPNLKLKYKTKPVHSLQEITKLKSHFPDNIRQFNVYKNNEIVAGTTIFESSRGAHTQYISGNEYNNSFGSLDFLHSHLISSVFIEKVFFDFGNSNMSNGQEINYGLLFWKEGFGARTVSQDFYVIDVDKYELLKKVLQ